VTTRSGDVKSLKSPLTGFRLRCGDYRIFFEANNKNALEIIGVRHRREAYR
jgi:mRNA-degrading endonuclease RelE of RelBE toxin-antitoxin system